MLLRAVGDLLVDLGVEQLDDEAVDVQRPRDVDLVAEAAGDPLGDAGLAVAGGAVEEHAAAGVDRRPERGEHLLVDQQVAERLAKLVLVRASRG